MPSENVEVPAGFYTGMGAGASWKRMVGKVDLWEGPETPFYNMRPWRATMTQGSFNCVFSLCDDGKHRAALDWDKPDEYPALIHTWSIPSTNNVHLYGTVGMTFHAYRDLINIQRRNGALQQGIYNQVCRLGFTVLRAPWEKKPERHDERLAELMELRRQQRRIEQEEAAVRAVRRPARRRVVSSPDYFGDPVPEHAPLMNEMFLSAMDSAPRIEANERSLLQEWDFGPIREPIQRLRFPALELDDDWAMITNDGNY